jgi:competence protein ComEC
LWLFALMVGMAPSVVRAVLMCTIYIIARWVSDDSSSSLHVLSLTALLMLLARPLYLFDVGFQLSFMAMVAILWLEPYLENLFLRHEWHPIGGFFVGVLCMSLAAQLGTFPLVLHHFGTFPTYFLVTNLFIAPCLSLLLVTSLVWWGLLLMGLSWAQSFGELLQYVIEYINRALQCIGQWPGAVMHVEDFSGWAVLFSYLFILFAALFVVKRWQRAAVLAMASLLALLICFI